MSVFISAPRIPWASSSSNPNWSLQEDKDKYIRGRNLGYIAASDPLHSIPPPPHLRNFYIQYQQNQNKKKKIGEKMQNLKNNLNLNLI